MFQRMHNALGDSEGDAARLRLFLKPEMWRWRWYSSRSMRAGGGQAVSVVLPETDKHERSLTTDPLMPRQEVELVRDERLASHQEVALRMLVKS